jgi:hypothetical protein
MGKSQFGYCLGLLAGLILVSKKHQEYYCIRFHSIEQRSLMGYHNTEEVGFLGFQAVQSQDMIGGAKEGVSLF